MGFNSAFKGLIQLSSWEWAQSCSKHVQDSNKHIIEEIVRQVGYLAELYEDARSGKHKMLYSQIWEGGSFENLLDIYTPWGSHAEEQACYVVQATSAKSGLQSGLFGIPRMYAAF